jgi:hypothetical protein
MKYRIENGEARIPLSELNRLNDEFEKLNEREKLIQKREIQLSKDLKDNTKMIIKKETMYDYSYPDWTFYMGNYQRYHVDIKDTFKELRDEYSLIVDEKIEKVLAEAETKRKEMEDKFKNMSIKEFKKWKKGD